MHANSSRLRDLRASRHWSQEQLAELSGLNLRTIQRLESGAKISTESLRALAAVFEVPPDRLLSGAPTPSQPALKAMHDCARRGLAFVGTTPRADFWWFALAVALVLALAQVLAEAVGPLPLQIASLVVLVPCGSQPAPGACATPASIPGGSSSAWSRSQASSCRSIC